MTFSTFFLLAVVTNLRVIGLCCLESWLKLFQIAKNTKQICNNNNNNNMCNFTCFEVVMKPRLRNEAFIKKAQNEHEILKWVIHKGNHSQLWVIHKWRHNPFSLTWHCRVLNTCGSPAMFACVLENCNGKKRRLIFYSLRKLRLGKRYRMCKCVSVCVFEWVREREREREEVRCKKVVYFLQL